MPFTKTHIKDLIIFDPQVWKDDRGYFFESYNQKLFENAGIRANFVQDNEAASTYGVIRGLHYQCGASAQAKLVRVTQGEVLDLVVDIRPESNTYGEWYSILLSADNKKQLFVPRGFAHGYAVLSPTAVFNYKCDNFYDKAAEGGIAYNDPRLNIDWQISMDKAVISEKDQIWPNFGQHKAINL